MTTESHDRPQGRHPAGLGCNDGLGLVERLRLAAARKWPDHADSLFWQAADEIERLTEDVDGLRHRRPPRSMSNEDKKDLAQEIKHLAFGLADATVRLKGASTSLWIQVRSSEVEAIEHKLRAAIDRLAAINDVFEARPAKTRAETQTALATPNYRANLDPTA